jgi:hypothetical protein
MNATIRKIAAAFSLLIVTTSAAQQDVSARARQAHEDRKSAINAFMQLYTGIPQILVGKDPWPPQPFPY